MPFGFLKKITKPFSDVAATIGDAGKSVWKSVVKPVYNEAVKPVFTTGMGIVEKTADVGLNLVDKAGSATINVTENMAKSAATFPTKMMDTFQNPFFLVALVVGGIVVVNLIRR